MNRLLFVALSRRYLTFAVRTETILVRDNFRGEADRIVVFRNESGKTIWLLYWVFFRDANLKMFDDLVSSVTDHVNIVESRE